MMQKIYSPETQSAILTIFIADDSAAVRQRMATLVAELAGIQLVGQADDMQDALAAIQSLKPAVVLLDTHLPGGKTRQVLTAIKAVQPSPCVIMLSAFSYPSCRRKYLEYGADYCFHRATEFQRVIAVLVGLLFQIEKVPMLAGQWSLEVEK